MEVAPDSTPVQGGVITLSYDDPRLGPNVRQHPVSRLPLDVPFSEIAAGSKYQIIWRLPSDAVECGTFELGSAEQKRATTHVDANHWQVVPFLEGTDVFTASPRVDLIFEAHIVPNLVLAQNFSRQIEPRSLVASSTPSRKYKFAYSFSAAPAVRLRMFDHRSSPVRTPSYMPKVTGQAFWFIGEPRGTVGLWAFQLTIGHHSNGQDGCLFTNQAVVDGECLQVSNAPRAVNRRDGSFSTNYVTVGGRYRRTYLGVDNRGRREWTGGFDYETHPKGFGPGGISAALRPLYGANRVSALAGFASRGVPLGRRRVCDGRFDVRAMWRYTFGLDTLAAEGDAAATPQAASVKASCIFSEAGGWGLFVRGYRGQDYYNLGFSRNISRVQVGLTYEQDGFLWFVGKTRGGEPRR